MLPDDRLDIAYWHPKFDNLISYLSSTKFEVKELSKLVLSPIISGKTPEQYIFPMTGIVFVGARNVRSGKIDLSDSTFIDEDIHNGRLKSSKISTGDVLVTMAGSIGRCAIYSERKEANISQSVARVKPNLTVLDPQYLVYYLNSPFGQIQFDRIRHDVNQPNINGTEIGRIQIIRPPLEIQKNIVKQMIAVEKKVSTLTLKRQKNLQKLRNLVLSKSDLKIPSINVDYYIQNIEAVEERLDFVFNHPNTHQIKQYLKSKGAVPLGSIIENEFEYGINDYGRETGNIPFVNVENLNTDGSIHTEGIHYVNEVSNKKKILDENDILISRSRSVGVCSLVTQTEVGFTYGSFILKFRINSKSQITPQYVVNFINSDLGQAQISYLQTGARETKPGGGNNINPDQLKQLMIISPSTTKHQTAIITAIKKLKTEQVKENVELEENIKIYSTSFEKLISSC